MVSSVLIGAVPLPPVVIDPAVLERGWTIDPGAGAMRHVDAGYDRAVEVAGDRGTDVPALGS